VPDRLTRQAYGLGAAGDAGSGSASRPGPPGAKTLASTASALFFIGLLALGAWGPPDPLENPLPLTVWTVFWLGVVFVQATAGDVWAWVNPWEGPARLLFRGRTLCRLPSAVGVWLAWAGYLAFAGFLLADIAPSDPARLAHVAGLYWAVNLVLCGVCGPGWLSRGEALTVLLGLYARLSPFTRHAPFVRLPGRRLVQGSGAAPALTVFAVSVLAIGAFDGLNETFWWMARIGLNPLAFPGRSAVVWQTLAGIGGAVVVLNLAFAGAVWLGAALAGQAHRFGALYARLGLTILPIAFAYHMAHYLTAALVGFQYAALALNDPLDSGANLLGLAGWYVTTGFFSQRGSMLAIWLSQAGAIVLGHMLGVIMAHAVTVDVLGGGKRALLMQLPVALFMIGLTLFGLWLLASPTVT